jgi:hypothetical protein
MFGASAEDMRKMEGENDNSCQQQHSRRITQAYFDQLVQENAEDFEISIEESIEETIQQLEASGVPYDHLLLTAAAAASAGGTHDGGASVETDAADLERRERAEFDRCLNLLRQHARTAQVPSQSSSLAPCLEADEEESLLEIPLSTLHSCLIKDWKTYSKLWDATSDAFSIHLGLFVKLLHGPNASTEPELKTTTEAPSGALALADRVLDIMSHVLDQKSRQFDEMIKPVQPLFTPDFMQAWMKLLDIHCVGGRGSPIDPASVSSCRRLLSVAYWSCKRSETNKQLWMEQRLHMEDGRVMFLVDMVLRLLSSVASFVSPAEKGGEPSRGADIDALSSLLFAIYRWITVLCRNDFDGSADELPLTASATSRVQQFTSSGLLVAVLRQQLSGVAIEGAPPRTDEALPTYLADPELLVALLQACRAVAIHNDVVIAMRQEGLVVTVMSLFEQIHLSSPDTIMMDLAVLASLIGLFRNLCANDDLKILLGNRILPALAERFSDLVHEPDCKPTVSMLEQFCGLVAALTLRHPGNAHQLVRLGAAETLVDCMRMFPKSPSLQRNAAYAIRNLVSRLEQHRDDANVVAVDRRELQELCQPVLVQAARLHADCQEAAYAALRDLGCANARLSRVVVDPTGQAKLVPGTSMFQPGSNAGFRAVYD